MTQAERGLWLLSRPCHRLLATTESTHLKFTKHTYQCFKTSWHMKLSVTKHFWSSITLWILLCIIYELLTLCHTVLKMIAHRGTYVLLSDSLYYIYLIIYWGCVCVFMSVFEKCIWGGREMNSWRSEENLVTSVLSPDHLSPRDWTQDVRIGRRCLWTLSQLLGPQCCTPHSLSVCFHTPSTLRGKIKHPSTKSSKA